MTTKTDRWICAVGAGLIGGFVWLHLHQISSSMHAPYARPEWWEGGRLLVTGIFVVGAGLGGAYSASLFGKVSDSLRKKIWNGFMGAVMSTFIGGMSVGALTGVSQMFILGTAGFEDIVFLTLFLAFMGSFGGFILIFLSLVTAFVWILGFTLLDILMRKRRITRTLNQTERAASKTMRPRPGFGGGKSGKFPHRQVSEIEGLPSRFSPHE